MTDPLYLHRKIVSFMRYQVGHPGVFGRCGVIWFALPRSSVPTAEAKKMGFLPAQPALLIFKNDMKIAVYLSEQKNMDHSPDGFLINICLDFSGFVDMIKFSDIFRIVD